MKLTFNRSQHFRVPEKLEAILNTELEQTNLVELKTKGIVFNFRDVDYSADGGGFHPVEIRIIEKDGLWQFEYVTDFSYLGHPYPELVKEIDICFINNTVYQLFIGTIEDEVDAKELMNLMLTNFIHYVEMDLFTVSLSFD